MSAEKIILCDVDGVAGDLVLYTLNKLARQFSRNTLPSREDLKGQHDLFKRGKTPLTMEQLVASHKLLASSRFAQNLPLIDGAQESIRAIKKAKHKVIWLTAPWLSSKTWDYDRRLWLLKNFKSQPTDVILAHQKQLVDGDVFIDDKPSHILEWRANHPNGRALLFDQPWNKDDVAPSGEKPFERFSWDQTTSLLKELANV